MEKEIDRHNFAEQFLIAFPELEQSYREQAKDYADDEKTLGNYLLMGLVLRPHLEKQFDQGECTDFLLRLASFMEKVCSSSHPEAINVIDIEVFANLLAEPGRVKLLWPVLGDCTKKEMAEAARRLNRMEALPKTPLWSRFLR